MKRPIKTVLILFMIAVLTCLSGVNLLALTTIPLSFDNQEAFHRAILKRKQQHAIDGKYVEGTLEEIDKYIDFMTIKNELSLVEIRARDVYVTLDYASEDEAQSHLILQWSRPVYGGNYDYLESSKSMYGKGKYIDIMVNNSPGIKIPLYMDGKFVSYQYRWSENEFDVFLRIPSWLLDLYPEEDFFNIRIVNIMGDVNFDGHVDIWDILAVRDHIFDTAPLDDVALLATDFSGTGKLDVLSIMGIRDIIFGLA